MKVSTFIKKMLYVTIVLSLMMAMSNLAFAQIYQDPTGNVGIGTTNPSRKLHVEVAANSQKALCWCSTGQADLNIYRDNDMGDWALLRSNLGQGIIIIGRPDFPSVAVSRATNNVGIGTTSPKRGLHVQMPENGSSVGAGILMSGGLSGNANIELRNQSGGTPYIDFSNDVSVDYDMRIRQTGNDKLVIEGGNVGIGTTSPKRGLHVQMPENSSSVGAGILMSGGLSGNANIELRNQSGGTPYIDFSNDVSVDYDMRIRQTGNDKLVIEGGNFGVYGDIYHNNSKVHSDERLKKEIEPLEDSLDKVAELQGVSYKWRTEEYPEMGFTDDTQIGLIAQEVEEVIPELVYTDDNGYKSISYERLTAVLVEAIKELKAENEGLRDEIAQIKEAMGL